MLCMDVVFRDVFQVRIQIVKKMDSTKKFVNIVLAFRGVIGSGGLYTTSPGHTIRYIKRFG